MKAQFAPADPNPGSKTVARKRAAKRRPAAKLSERQQQGLRDALKRYVRAHPEFDAHKI